jgi:hypothetical protein
MPKYIQKLKILKCSLSLILVTINFYRKTNYFLNFLQLYDNTCLKMKPKIYIFKTPYILF